MLTINLVWDANALAAPQSFRDGVRAAANVLEAAILTPITVNIAVGYGEYDLGGPSYVPLPSGISLGGVNNSVQVSYPLLKAALTAAAASASAPQAVNALPDTPSLNGQSTFYISTAQAKAFGAIGSTAPAIDGFVGFPPNFTGKTLVSAGIAELVHAIGLLNNSFSLSLFEYTSPGNHLLTSGTASTPAYFSIDGGKTNLANYDVGFDSTLFLNQPNDPLNVPISGSATLTALDLLEIGAVGFNVSATPTLPGPSLATTPSAKNAIVVTGRNTTVAVNTAVSAASLISAVSVPGGDTVVTYAFYDSGAGGGHFAVNGVVEPAQQWIYALSTQLNVLTYVGGASPGSETLSVFALSAAGQGVYQTGTLTATTVAAPASKVVNNADGTSSVIVAAPSLTVSQAITSYTAANAGGTMTSRIVDNLDGTSALYAFNPTRTVTLTVSQYSGTDPANGAPTGSKISDVVDNADGTSIIYAYNPTATVVQTTTKFAGTNPDGSAAGALISAVVGNRDGTSLIYAYNPSSTVVQTTSKFAGTNPVDGSPTGARISDVVDNTDGTSILYAYNPTSAVILTATKYTATNADGSPAGSAVSVVFDYTAGGSSVTAYANGKASNTIYYTGVDGTGSVRASAANQAPTQADAALASDTISALASIDPAGQAAVPSLEFLTAADSPVATPNPAAPDEVLAETLAAMAGLPSSAADPAIRDQVYAPIPGFAAYDAVTATATPFILASDNGMRL